MIKFIIHLSDLHIRTFQLHDLYKKQFKKFIKEIKNKFSEYSKDEIRIVITGDIAHQKINISNEQILLTSWFLTQLTTIGKVIIIPGNHDFLENNIQRLDSITPVVELLNNDDITYYKDGGVYEDNNIKWVVYSLYQHNERPEFEKTDGTYIGLFHGPIQGFSTDLGYQFDDAYDKINFYGCDIVLCGDIHKRAIVNLESEIEVDEKDVENKEKYKHLIEWEKKIKLVKKIPIIQIGSLIQQNFGETVKHHGYGTYDLETKDYKFHDLDNDRPYYHFSISDIKDIENETEELLNLG
jgi:DNA repair exonuclease SbcCD nuclease subunit